jgi:Leucine-rich repeat (LRR) protein
MYRRITTILLLIITALQLNAQNKSLTSEEIERYKDQCKSMISYFEGTLNFLGDPNQVISEKEIIINESYLKIFRDPKVQIEDDLDPNREVPLRKDVQAYLKDIVFFFKKVQFKFEVKNVEVITTEDGETGFKITMNRQLKGIMVNNDTLDNNLTRYVEINLDPYNQDLRIVSIYTTLPDQTEEMRYWWKTLPTAWKNFFGSKVLVYDTLPMNMIASFEDSTVVISSVCDTVMVTDSLLIKGNDTLRFSEKENLKKDEYIIRYLYDTLQITCYDTVRASVTALDFYLKSILRLKELDISNNKTIKTLDPVSRLTALESFNCSNTSVSDLLPVRNLSKLKELNFSQNEIFTLKPLRFCFALEELNMSETPIDSVNTLANLTTLEKITMDHTNVSDLSPLKELQNLKFLSLAYTPVTDLSPLSGLSSLKRLIIKGTAITDLSPLSTLSALEYINMDDTPVSDISPLAKIPSLTTIQANNTKLHDFDGLGKNQTIRLIYCDNTGIDLVKAMEFMDKNPQALVIYNSGRLNSWWKNLPEPWKKVLTKQCKLGDTITKEQLHKIVNTKKISIAGNKEITDLEPVKMLFRLENIDLSNTNISNLAPLSGLSNLRYLNIENTPVSSLQSLSDLSTLRKVRMDNTRVSDLLPLKNNHSLKKVFCDNTLVKKPNVLEFKKHVPDCLVVYQTEVLSFWWNNMEEAWRQVLEQQINIDGDPSREQLQEIVDLKKVTIKNNSNLFELEPLAVFNFLEDLQINNTGIYDITPLSVLDSLKILNLSNNPVSDITPLAKLTGLRELYLENTGIYDLTPLEGLVNLQVLNIAGTKVKKLKPLSGLKNLEKLIINNTEVNKLKDINNLKKLKYIRCYNTNLKSKKVDEFKTSHPKTEVVFY